MSGDFYIGDWRVQPAVNRLSRGGHVVRVEPKVMQVLVCLAENAGEVVTREQLIATVWPDVFVTDDVLHRAIRELRRVFGDSTSAPSYIETIRKRGYRLMQPRVAPPSVFSRPVPGIGDSPPPAGPAPDLGDRPRTWQFSLLAAAVTVTVVTAVLMVASRSPDSAPQAHARFVPVVSGPLNESDPAMSPDGRHIAFVQRPAGGLMSADIYVRDLRDGAVTRVTHDSASDRMPAWAPDASRLAFVRMTSTSCEIIVRTLATNTEQRVAACGNAEAPRIAWTTDGSALLTSLAHDANAGWRIARFSLNGGWTPLTEPPHGMVGDHSPAMSPSGRHIAFIRRASGGVSDIFIAAIDGSEPRRVTFEEADLTGIDWSGDGRAIVYSSDRAGGYSLWRVSVDGGAPALLAGGAARMKHPVADRAARRVVYENWNYEINLWRVPLAGPLANGRATAQQAAPVTRTSELWNLYPQISPDGSRMAYVSTQSGSHELWLADADGNHARRLTHFDRGVVKMPRWSPDGRRIVYLARGQGAVDVHYVDVATGTSTQVTSTPANEVAPAWSHDGSRILFGGLDHRGRWNVWSVALARANDNRLEIADAVAAQPAPDGSALYFTRPDRPGVWRSVTAQSPPALIVEDIAPGDTLGWLVTARGVYSVAERGDVIELRMTELMGGPSRDVATLPQYTWPGFSVSPDGTTAAYARWDRRDSNLMSIEY